MSNSEYEIERGVYQTPSNDDDLYDEYDDEEGFGRGPVFAIFAVIVLAAFVGIVWLAYQQGLRQGQMASPPIVAASGDPFKVEPDDPEGMPAPEESLTDEVLAGEALDQEPTTVTRSSEEPIETARAGSGEETAPSLRTSDVDVADEETGAGELTVPPPSSRVRDADVAASSAGSADEPVARGAEVAAAAEEEPAAEPELPPATTATARPSSVATGFAADGGYVVQIASVPERADANGVWSRMVSRYGTIIEGYAQDVQAVDLGDRGTWYRLRIGYFETSADAGALCDELKDAGQDCLVASR